MGYLSGKATSKVLNVKVNIPLLFFVAAMPDVDLLIPGLQHRGPTHSIIISCLLFLPIYILFGKRAMPYFIALIQHSLIGDYLVNTTQLFWPISVNWYGLGIGMTSSANVFTEWILFLSSVTIMFKTGNARLLFQNNTSNLILCIPVFTVLLPTFLSFPLPIPPQLIVPHLTYLMLFTLSAIICVKTIMM